MTTNIRIDVLLRRLTQQVSDVVFQNRQAKEERESATLQSTQAGQAPTESVVGEINGKTLTVKETREQSAKQHSAVPDTYKQRRPAAQRSGSGWGILSYDWLAITGVGDTGIANPSGGTFIYQLINSKDLRLLLSTSKTAVSSPYRQASAYPQNAFALERAGAGVSSNSTNHNNLRIILRAGEFAGVAYGGGNYYFTQAPVVASSNTILYGVFRHSIGQINTPWQGNQNGYFTYSVNGLTYNYTYVYFRFDTVSGALDLKSASVSYDVPQNGTITNFAPYVEGGSVWAAQYEANAFPGDPSVNLRKLGYYGDCHIRGRKAYMLRYRLTDTFYEPLSALNSRVLWNKGDTLKWLVFDLSSSISDTAALKAELDQCVPTIPSKPYTVEDAFTRQADIDKFNQLSSAVVADILPTGDDQYWSPTGPFTYPMLTP